jgi:hypothetical protein
VKRFTLACVFLRLCEKALTPERRKPWDLAVEPGARREVPMSNDRGQSGPENDLQRRELQARYLQDALGSARASRRLRRAMAGLGVAMLALIAFTSFSPPRGSVPPERSSISPSEITATLSDIPESQRWDAH